MRTTRLFRATRPVRTRKRKHSRVKEFVGGVSHGDNQTAVDGLGPPSETAASRLRQTAPAVQPGPQPPAAPKGPASLDAILRYRPRFRPDRRPR